MQVCDLLHSHLHLEWLKEIVSSHQPVTMRKVSGTPPTEQLSIAVVRIK